MASRVRLQPYHELSNLRAGLDLALHWGALLGLFTLCHQWGHPLGYLLAIVVIAGLQNAMASLSHEAWHQKTFTHRPTNDVVGAWLYSYPIGLPFFHDRRRHLQHHQRVGGPTDPDWPNYSDEARETGPRLLFWLFGKLVGMHLVITVWTTVVRGRPRIDVGEARDETGPSTRRELASVALVQLVLFAGFALLGSWWEYVVLWLVPLATLTAFLISTRAFLEHGHPEPDPPPEARLCDFDTNAAGHFFLSPCHFHLHALHHAYPGVPHYRLPELKQQLAEPSGLGYPGRQRPGYLRVLREHLQSLRAQRAA